MGPQRYINKRGGSRERLIIIVQAANSTSSRASSYQVFKTTRDLVHRERMSGAAAISSMSSTNSVSITDNRGFIGHKSSGGISMVDGFILDVARHFHRASRSTWRHVRSQEDIHPWLPVASAVVFHVRPFLQLGVHPTVRVPWTSGHWSCTAGAEWNRVDWSIISAWG